MKYLKSRPSLYQRQLNTTAHSYTQLFSLNLSFFHVLFDGYNPSHVVELCRRGNDVYLDSINDH